MLSGHLYSREVGYAKGVREMGERISGTAEEG
jgi:hypothetical protein